MLLSTLTRLDMSTVSRQQEVRVEIPKGDQQTQNINNVKLSKNDVKTETASAKLFTKNDIATTKKTKVPDGSVPRENTGNFFQKIIAFIKNAIRSIKKDNSASPTKVKDSNTVNKSLQNDKLNGTSKVNSTSSSEKTVATTQVAPPPEPPSPESLKLFSALNQKPTDVQTLKELLSSSPEVVNKYDANGYTPLAHAFSNNDAAAIAALLEAGADPNHPLINGDNLLHLFVRSEPVNLELIEKLVSAGVNVDTEKKENGITPLMLAISKQPANPQLIEKLLASPNLNVSKNLKFPPIMFAISRGNCDESILGMLIKKGYDINAKNSTGEAAIFNLIRKPDFDEKKLNILKLLIDNKANVNESYEGITVLTKLISKNNFNECDLKAFNMLMENNSSVSSNDIWLLIPKCSTERCKGPRVEVLKHLVRHADLRAQDSKEGTFVNLFCKTLQDKELKKELLSVVKERDEMLAMETTEQLRMQAVGHAFSIGGKVKVAMKPGKGNISNKECKLEGGMQTYWLKKMGKATEKLANEPQYKNLIPPEDSKVLLDALNFSAEMSMKDPKEILSRIKAGEPTIIPTGYDGHAVSVLVWGSNLVICNRGGMSRNQTEFYKFNPEKFDENTIQQIIDASSKDPNAYKKLFFEDLQADLEFKQDATQVTQH